MLFKNSNRFLMVHILAKLMQDTNVNIWGTMVIKNIFEAYKEILRLTHHHVLYEIIVVSLGQLFISSLLILNKDKIVWGELVKWLVSLP